MVFEGASADTVHGSTYSLAFIAPPHGTAPIFPSKNEMPKFVRMRDHMKWVDKKSTHHCLAGTK